ncbi:glycoside hydrolase family 5 protein [Nocardioides humilatus]|uniref:Glycoside hydrolase family 5 protein n=1 Tax=Nocardioides humilatus TaxID=2607660 RepID=A0A5B1LK41_9ACTN|nr:cellulase family glycosylhydrolase [Nocardioides humilatus]KAA1420923.1 glycoside hydrolase family 5 protein [Nocardioides humilatus]
MISAVLLTALAAAPGASGSTAATAAAPTHISDAVAAPDPRPTPSGRFLLDPQGRALVLHGVNMVYKLPPYAPDEIGFDADDAQFLVDQGFTTVRLGLIWKAVEPEPGQYDDAYLSRIRATTELLAAHGIWVLLDFHQDLFHERFQGEGAPDWAVQDDGLPAEPQLGFPYNYFGQLALNRAFDHFWANSPAPDGIGLQDHYAAAWAHVASYFLATPGVMGFDLFNEPWPGTSFPKCVNPLGCRGFDKKLQAFSQRVIDQIRTVDARTPIFYEPHVLFNNGVRTSLTPRGPRLGFSFHDYCLTADLGLEGTPVQDISCNVFDNLVWANTEAQLKRTGDTPLLTEFGATTDTKVLTEMVDRAAEHRWGWQYWAYTGFDPTTTGPGDEQSLVRDPSQPPTGDNLDEAKLDAIVTPHPLVVSGTPTAWHFDRATGEFTTSWTTKKVRGLGSFAAGSLTRIALPTRVYDAGYDVTVTGGQVVSVADAPVLVVRQQAGASSIAVTVTPR